MQFSRGQTSVVMPVSIFAVNKELKFKQRPCADLTLGS